MVRTAVKGIKTRKSSKGDLAEDIGNLLTRLENVYWNGFSHRATSYKIARSKLRELLGLGRLESGTMKKIRDAARARGFVLHPLDSDEVSSAKQWIFQRLKPLEASPPGDDSAFRRAESRHA